MEYVLTGEEMKAADKRTMKHFLVPSMVLMERAALAFVEELLSSNLPLGHVLAVCGPGNNGGDGFAAARLLKERGYKVSAVLIGDDAKCTEQTRQQMAILEKYGVSIGRRISPDEYTVIIDGIFGIGLVRPLKGVFKEAVEWINGSGLPVAALDIPSGIHADTGAVMGVAVKATLTVAFAFLKAGHLLYPGAEYTGEICVRGVGITEASLGGEAPSFLSLERSDLSLLPARRPRSHKGTYGRVLVIAGSPGMAGAAALCAEGALRSGAGLVKILTPEANRVVLQSILPEAMTVCYEGKQPGEGQVRDALDWADVLCIGPGIGITQEMRSLLLKVLACGKPAVVDADGLRLLAECTQCKERLIYRKGGAELVLTPHPGEMSALTGKRAADILKDIPGTARAFAGEYKTVCVLKDARTVTAIPDGPSYINRSGNSGMATGGSGDVLTGIFGGLMAQGLSGELAAPLGVYVHGLAGDEAAERLGCYSMTARDILAHLGGITRENSSEVMQ